MYLSKAFIGACLPLFLGAWANVAEEACASTEGAEEAASLLQVQTKQQGVKCPGSSAFCNGNQCCPGISANGWKTFPCPNAPKFGGCGTKKQPSFGSKGAKEGERCDKDDDCADKMTCFEGGVGRSDPSRTGKKTCHALREEGESCGSSFWVDQHGTCRDGLECQVFNPMIPDAPNICRVPGSNKKKGDTCDFNTNRCEDGLWCEVKDPSVDFTKVCRGMATEGQPCDEEYDCGGPLTCWTGQRGVGKTCNARKKEGETCGSSFFVPYFGDCEYGLSCEVFDPRIPDAPNRCKKPGKQKGETCNRNVEGDCATGLSCQIFIPNGNDLLNSKYTCQ